MSLLQAVPFYSMRNFHCCNWVALSSAAVRPMSGAHVPTAPYSFSQRASFFLYPPFLFHPPVLHLPFKIFRKSVNLSDYTASRLCRQQCLLYSTGAFVVSHLPFFDPYNYVRPEEHSPPPPTSISRWRSVLVTVIFFLTLVAIWLHGYVDVRVWLTVCLSVCLRRKGF